jgi:hypothetical protein
MGKLSKRRLLDQGKREYERIKDDDRPVVMTKDVETRFLTMKRAEARKNCPLCDALFEPEMTSYCRGRYEDWRVEKVCPNCGVVEETMSGARKTGKKSLMEVKMGG